MNELIYSTGHGHGLIEHGKYHGLLQLLMMRHGQLQLQAALKGESRSLYSPQFHSLLPLLILFIIPSGGLAIDGGASADAADASTRQGVGDCKADKANGDNESPPLELPERDEPPTEQ